MKRSMIKIHLISKALVAYSLCCLPFALSGQPGSAASKEASIRVYLPEANAEDTIRYVGFRHTFTDVTDLNQEHTEAYPVREGAGYFMFRIPSLDRPGYFSLLENSRAGKLREFIQIISMYLMEPGDDVVLRAEKDTSYRPQEHLVRASGLGMIPEVEAFGTRYQKEYRLVFSGRGAAKYRLRYALDKLVERGGSNYDGLLHAGLKLIDQGRDSLSRMAYDLLRADFVGRLELLKVKTGEYRDSLSVSGKRYPDSLFPDTVIALSASFPQFIIQRDARISKEKHNSTDMLKRLADTYPPGLLRDKLLTIFLLNNNEFLPEKTVEHAVSQVADPFYAGELRKLRSHLNPGTPAFDFLLPDTSGRAVRLSDFRGKVVFVDFWFTGCGGCAAYYKNVVSKVEQQFEKNPDVVFISVSVDRTKEKWLNGLRSGAYTSSKVLNVYTGGQGSLHPVIKHYGITAYPRPFLIDKKGKIYSGKMEELYSGGPEILAGTIIRALKK